MILHHRKLNRLKNYDYSSSGYYFITICTKNRQEHFGNIVNNGMILNKCGEIIHNQWLWLEKQYKYVELDVFQIMPNHFHGILIIRQNLLSTVGNGRDRSLRIKIKSLSELMGAFKTTSSKLIHQLGKYSFQWQKSYYDHIIRNEILLFYIRQYIRDNPMNWNEDRNNI